MTTKVIISLEDAKDLYIRTLSSCDIHNADKYAAQLFFRVLCDFIVGEAAVHSVTYRHHSPVLDKPEVKDEKSTD